MKQEPIPLKQEPVPIKREPIPTKQEPIPNKREPIPTKREPIPTKREPIPTQREPIPLNESQFREPDFHRQQKSMVVFNILAPYFTPLTLSHIAPHSLVWACTIIQPGQNRVQAAGGLANAFGIFRGGTAVRCVF